MHLLALGAFWRRRKQTWHESTPASLNAPFGARCFLTVRRVVPLVAREAPCRIASGRKSTPPTSKYEARLPDFSLRLRASPRNACGADAVLEIAAVTGVSISHSTSHL